MSLRWETKELRISIDWTYGYVPMLRNQKTKRITVDGSYKAIEGTIEYALDEHMMRTERSKEISFRWKLGLHPNDGKS